jgi:small subunit ribosomal protein S21
VLKIYCLGTCKIIPYRIQLPPMISVSKKDSKESLDNLLRRFNRKVQQSGVITSVKQTQYFEKPLTKRERRLKAIIRQERKAAKLKKIKLGQR